MFLKWLLSRARAPPAEAAEVVAAEPVLDYGRRRWRRRSDIGRRRRPVEAELSAQRDPEGPRLAEEAPNRLGRALGAAQKPASAPRCEHDPWSGASNATCEILGVEEVLGPELDRPRVGARASPTRHSRSQRPSASFRCRDRSRCCITRVAGRRRRRGRAGPSPPMGGVQASELVMVHSGALEMRRPGSWNKRWMSGRPLAADEIVAVLGVRVWSRPRSMRDRAAGR